MAGARTRPRRVSVGQTLALADLYRVLALGISDPAPGRAIAMRRGMSALVRAAEGGLLPCNLLGSLRRCLNAWRGRAGDMLGEEYSRLFLGQAMVPLREGGYGDGQRFAGQPVDIADASGFYLAFGFGPPQSGACPPDHLGTELEFLSLLHVKSALARQRRRHEQVAVTQQAMAHFLRDHLGRWIGAFAAALREAHAAPEYLSLAALAELVVAIECRRLGVAPATARVGTATDPLQTDDLSCPLEERPQNGTAARL